jgi:site-specific recombinase XerD
MTGAVIQKRLVQFQKHLEKERKHANTIRSYLNDVTQFLKWVTVTLGNDFTVDDITRGEIVDYRGFLLTRKISATSVNRRITALRQFLAMWVQEGVLAKNPAEDVAGIPNVPQLPPVLSRKDALLLIRTAEQSTRNLESSVILLLLHAGLRSSEICNATIGDLQMTPRVGRLFIRGARGKTVRFVYLSTRTQAALRQYCKRNGITVLLKKRRAEPLFTQSSGGPLTQQSIDHLVKRIGKQTGIPGVTPTLLRNTYAVQALLNGESAEAVARSMGVSSVRPLVKILEQIKAQNGAS